jgi:hypothetical protein
VDGNPLKTNFSYFRHGIGGKLIGWWANPNFQIKIQGQLLATGEKLEDRAAALRPKGEFGAT